MTLSPGAQELLDLIRQSQMKALPIALCDKRYRKELLRAGLVYAETVIWTKQIEGGAIESKRVMLFLKRETGESTP